MLPKQITVSYLIHKEDQSALDYALHLASRYSSHVEAIHVIPEPEGNTFVDPALIYGAYPYYSEEMTLDFKKANEKRRKEAQEAFIKTVKEKHAQLSSFCCQKGIVEDVLATKGRVSDLIVLSRTDENVLYNNAINGALFGSGCPVLLVPPHTGFRFNNNILIAWNGSREAANAVAKALPYMRDSRVSIMVEEESKDRLPTTSAYDLRTFLLRHEIDVDLIPPLKKETSLPVSILNTAQTVDAGLIVMGAWGHSRFREFIRGGVTDYMLHHAGMPIFMAH